MNGNKSSVSKAQSYREIGEFWDTHDVTDYWDETKPVNFEVEIESEVTYFAIQNQLADQVEQIARKQGVSIETLLNLWVQDRVAKELA
jgi:metal-dependent HD superfamily phosphatase/phosphodiesterase